MRKKRCMWIRELVTSDDPSLLMTIRNYYGQRTENFDDVQLYEKAKKLYENNANGVKNWGKLFKNIKPIELKTQVKTEETTNANNNSTVIE
jgi:hypothetical protein